MSKNSVSNKVLVRNVSLPTASRNTGKSQMSKKVHFSDDFSEGGGHIFSVPRFCSLLQLADEMAAVRNTQGSSHSQPEESKYKYLNFSPEKKIYQDLVGVDIPEKETINQIRSEPCVKLKKDPHLCVHKYTKYNLECGYVFSSYAAPSVRKGKIESARHSLYNKMALWRKFMD